MATQEDFTNLKGTLTRLFERVVEVILDHEKHQLNVPGEKILHDIAPLTKLFQSLGDPVQKEDILGALAAEILQSPDIETDYGLFVDMRGIIDRSGPVEAYEHAISCMRLLEETRSRMENPKPGTKPN